MARRGIVTLGALLLGFRMKDWMEAADVGACKFVVHEVGGHGPERGPVGRWERLQALFGKKFYPDRAWVKFDVGKDLGWGTELHNGKNTRQQRH